MAETQVRAQRAGGSHEGGEDIRPRLEAARTSSACGSRRARAPVGRAVGRGGRADRADLRLRRFGKSTLAAQWSARCERPVVWVNLDRGDNDPVVLLGYLANALDRVDPVAQELLEELSARAPRIDEVVVPPWRPSSCACRRSS